VDSHGTTSVIINPLKRIRIQEVEDVTITIIVHATRDVEMIGDTTVVIVAVTTVSQATVVDPPLGVE